MPRRSANADKPGSAKTAGGCVRVLLVDGDPGAGAALVEAVRDRNIELDQAATLRDARRALSQKAADVVLIEPTLPDGSGIKLARELRDQRSSPQTIVITSEHNFDTAVQAVRCGVTDVMTKPLSPSELSDRLTLAIDRQRADRRRDHRVRKLRRMCRKLETARADISQQVDVLCNDLVGAYQELATQMHNVVYTSEFAALTKKELDLEQLIRKVLEYALDKAGPTNAAIFLPCSADEYTVGGYVNYDTVGGSPDLLLQHLADVAVPKLAEREEPVAISDNDTMSHWLGDDAAYLADCHLLAVPCRHEDETLAVIVLFRDASQPYEPTVGHACAAISDTLASYLARIIRVHHRHVPEAPYEADEDEGDDDERTGGEDLAI